MSGVGPQNKTKGIIIEVTIPRFENEIVFYQTLTCVQNSAKSEMVTCEVCPLCFGMTRGVGGSLACPLPRYLIGNGEVSIQIDLKFTFITEELV